MGNEDTYCTYHQRKGHSTNSYNDLKVVILDLTAQGKYGIHHHAFHIEIVYGIKKFQEKCDEESYFQQHAILLEGHQ